MENDTIYLNPFKVLFKIRRHSNELIYNPDDWHPDQEGGTYCCQCQQPGYCHKQKPCSREKSCNDNEILKNWNNWNPPDLCSPLVWKKKTDFSCEQLDHNEGGCISWSGLGCTSWDTGLHCMKGHFKSNQFCGTFQPRDNCTLGIHNTFDSCIENKNDENFNFPRAGFATCQYKLPLINIMNNPEKKYNIVNFIYDVNNGTTKSFLSSFDQNQTQQVITFSYIYTWFYSFYNFIYTRNLLNFDIFSGDAQLRTQIIASLSPDPKKKFTDFSEKYMRFPIAYENNNLEIFLDSESFISLFYDCDFQKIQNNIKNILNNFFQEKKGQFNKPILIDFEFTLNDVSMFICNQQNILEATSNFFYEMSIQSDPFSIYVQLKNIIDNKRGEAWKPNLDEFFNITYDNKVCFIPLYKLTITITKWSPVITMYFLNQGILFQDCNKIYQDIGMDPVNCLDCIHNINDCIEKIKRSCINTYYHQNPYIFYKTNLLLESTNKKCYCYASNLTPILIDRYANKTSMCFDINCTNDDRKFYNLNDSSCKNECSTMYEWLHNKDPALQPRNQDLYFDQSRFNNICGTRYRPFRYNDRINRNILFCSLGVCICLFFILFHMKNRKWYIYICIPLVLSAISIYLAIDLKGESICDDKNKPICRSSVSKIKIPTYFCDSMKSCECLSLYSCGNDCVCQNQKCIPKFNDRVQTNTTALFKIQVNYIFIFFIIFYIFTLCWISVKRKLSIWIISIMILISAGIIVLSYFYLLPTKMEYNYKNICYQEQKIILDSITTNQNKLNILYDFGPIFINVMTKSDLFIFCVPNTMNNNIIIYKEDKNGSIQTDDTLLNYNYCIMPLSINNNISFRNFKIEAGKTNKKTYDFKTKYDGIPYIYFTTFYNQNKIIITKIENITETSISFTNFTLNDNQYQEIVDENIEIHIVVFGKTETPTKPNFVYGLSQNLIFNYYNIENPVIITNIVSQDINFISSINIKEIFSNSILVNVYTKNIGEINFKLDQKNNLISYMIFEETK